MTKLPTIIPVFKRCHLHQSETEFSLPLNGCHFHFWSIIIGLSQYLVESSVSGPSNDMFVTEVLPKYDMSPQLLTVMPPHKMTVNVEPEAHTRSYSALLSFVGRCG